MQEAPAGWRLTSGDLETILEELRRDFSGDLEIGGPTLAAGFIRRGLVEHDPLLRALADNVLGSALAQRTVNSGSVAEARARVPSRPSGHHAVEPPTGSRRRQPISR
jgi:hypothetical protein